MHVHAYPTLRVVGLTVIKKQTCQSAGTDSRQSIGTQRGQEVLNNRSPENFWTAIPHAMDCELASQSTSLQMVVDARVVRSCATRAVGDSVRRLVALGVEAILEYYLKARQFVT